MKKRIFIGLLINMIALLQITSCTEKASTTPTVTRINIGDGGLISGIPCSAPCFTKIIPGETTKDEAKMIINSQGWRCDTNDYPKINISSIKCERDTFGINFEYSSDILQNIYFDPTISIKIDQVINKYGNPDLYLLLPTSVPEHCTSSEHLRQKGQFAKRRFQRLLAAIIHSRFEANAWFAAVPMSAA